MNSLNNSRATVSAPFFYANLLNRLTKNLISNPRIMWLVGENYMHSILNHLRMPATPFLFKSETIEGK